MLGVEWVYEFGGVCEFWRMYIRIYKSPFKNCLIHKGVINYM